jgi:ribose 5-phosphate isomerase B
MKVYVSSDHAGFESKKILIDGLSDDYDVADLGPDKLDPDDDYPKYAEKLAKKIVAEKDSMGILTCGSGQGMAMVANKIKGIRAAVVWSQKVAKETRNDNDSNVLSLPARYLDSQQVVDIAKIWLSTAFSNQPRHKRRIEQIKSIEDHG